MAETPAVAKKPATAKALLKRPAAAGAVLRKPAADAATKKQALSHATKMAAWKNIHSRIYSATRKKELAKHGPLRPEETHGVLPEIKWQLLYSTPRKIC